MAGKNVDANLLRAYGVQPIPETARPMPAAPPGPTGDGLAVLVLCAGPLLPWEEGWAKQLRPVALSDPETVLGRIVRQVRENGHEPIVVTHRWDIREGAPDVGHFEPECRRTIAETWLYTRELWREQTAVLLGDVIHGAATMRETLAHRGSMMMVGDSAEIYAFTFPAEEHDRVAETLYRVDLETLKGSPWEIYRKWCGFPYRSGQREDEVFHLVWDRTGDIDGKRQYLGALTIDWGK